jgi:TolB protein
VIRRALPPSLVAALALAAAPGAVALLPGGTAAKPTQSHRNSDPAWSPDGTRIAFVAAGAGINDYDIWVMRADGTGFINLTPNVVLTERSHSWSPDGTRLAFTSTLNARDAASSVEVVDADGRGRRVLATGSRPAWSPDGTRIAYHGEGGIHVLGVAGGGDRLVAPAASSFAGRPSWSPDGRRIAYVRDGDVWVLDADRSDPLPLTSFPAGRFAYAPAWSPAGSTIAFAVASVSAPVSNDVWVVRDDGTGLRRVMRATFVEAGPDWAPDGRSLVFAAATSDNDAIDWEVELYRADVPDGPVVNVSNDDAWDETPEFAPDGGRLAFGVRHGGGYLLSDVFTLDLRTGKRRNLTGIASGQTIDARTVHPPNRLTLARVAAWLERSFPRRPTLRVEVRVSDKTRDEVRGAVVSVAPRLRGLEPLTSSAPLTDWHGNTQWGFRVLRPGSVRAGSRVRVLVSARPRGARYVRRVAVSRELRLRVDARPPVG